ncbi:glycyl radical protein [Clostridium estertheticum]|uniref:glycyl radical protein n=1 Tax=Clostridium estertheticum TaxID=238834 RepID=UPI001CF55686|nr:glycyl radical protein [Clostridium estertheticum]MCB2305643.1 glycyl radical protein [Clostridium estertheticum]MCB2344542.1 glycyl radical protein [Clostridium estertheticum]MCB2347998.1 glycyl radical protein [Clostridium estertheticum]WAG45643.1 glycyl radical protein [Clostridium estertheticum]
MYVVQDGFSKPTKRVEALKEQILSAVPCIEVERALLITESFKETEGKSIVVRRAKALEKILNEIPIIIRDEELIVGSLTKEARSAQIFPEFSNKWIKDEFETIGKRKGDSFQITEKAKEQLTEVFDYWEGKTTNELATSYMYPETIEAMNENVFTVANYYLNGVGHVSVDYAKVLAKGYKGIIEEVKCAIKNADKENPKYIKQKLFWESIIGSCKAVINYAHRYAKLAREMASKESNEKRAKELLQIAKNCETVPENGATNFYEACQSFWFVHAVINIESNGHSISPTRFDQYMYPYYEIELNSGKFDIDKIQELIDCVWVKLNDINKVRDEVSTRAFGGYPMFQNLCVGGQTREGKDATNDLSYMCIDATAHVRLSAPSFSVRIWNKTPDEFLLRSCELSRLGLGMPAFYNDEVVITALVSNGLTMEDAREYGIIGCVEPQKPGKTEGWHDSGFFNLARLLEVTINNGMSNGKQIGPKTGEFTKFKSIEEVVEAYTKQMEYFVYQLSVADNSIDLAHAERAPLPFLSCMVDDCITNGKSLQEGGAHYNFTGPQGVGVANVGDSFAAIKKLVFDTKKVTLKDLKEALDTNFGEEDPTLKENFEDLRQMLIHRAPKFGNDIDEVDELARQGAYIYCKEVAKHKNPRGGNFHAGLYPAAINILFGDLIGATPDGRKAHEALADGVSPVRGADSNGPTAAINSVAKLDHFIASNGTLLNQKFHPGSIQGSGGLKNLASLVRSFFDQKGMHVQFNIIDKETLVEAQKDPSKYRDLVVRVAGYSAQFITLDKAIQDDIIKRTEQTF